MTHTFVPARPSGSPSMPMTATAPRRILTKADAEWPRTLDELGTFTPPDALYVCGLPLDPSAVSVAVVGTRRPTAAGLEAAQLLATGLAEAGCVVVSGLAVGIDAAAHEAAIRAGGKTVAVVGCGLDVNYPRRNESLRRRLESHGTIISEHSDGTRPAPQNFPARNRIIVGLSSAVVVIEGGLQSGALITARIALDANRLVFAVPGSVRNPMAAGPNELIRTSQAALTTSVKDIFEEIAPSMVWSDSAPRSAGPPLEEEERDVLGVLDDTPVALDEVCRHLTLTPGRVAMILSRLEIRNFVLRKGGGYELSTAGARARAASPD